MYSSLKNCPYPNCYSCIGKAPKEQQQGMFIKAFRELHLATPELQDSWAATLKMLFCPNEKEDNDQSIRTKKNRGFWEVGAVDALVNLMLSPSCTQYTKYHGIMALMYLSSDPVSADRFCKMPQYVPFLLRTMNSRWVLFRFYNLMVINSVCFSSEAGITLEPLCNPRFFSTFLHTLNYSLEDMEQNWREGSFQAEFSNIEDNSEGGFSEIRYQTWRGVMQFSSIVFIANANNPKKMLSLLEGIKEKGRVLLLKRVFENLDISSILEGFAIIHVRSNIIHSMIVPGFMEPESDEEYRKSLLEIITRDDDECTMINFVTSTIKTELKVYFDNVKEIPLGSFGSFSPNFLFATLEYITRNKKLTEYFGLSNFHELFCYFYEQWTSIEHNGKKYRSDGFVEDYVDPAMGYSKFKIFFTAQTGWICVNLLLIILRLERYNPQFKSLNNSHSDLRYLINRTMEMAKATIGTIKDNKGRSQAFCDSLVLLTKEDNIIKKEEEEKDYIDWNFYNAKAYYIRAKTWIRLNLKINLPESTRKNVFLDDISKALSHIKDENNPLYKKIQQLKLQVSSDKCCNLCFKPANNIRKLSKCSRCKIVQYCSKDCQVKDWKSHKPICKPPN